MTRKSRREIKRLLDDLEPDSTGSGPATGLSGEVRDIAVDMMIDAYERVSEEKQAKIDEMLDKAVGQTENDDADPVSVLEEIGEILLKA